MLPTNEIVNLLRENNPMTINEISDQLNFNRHTTSKYLSVLESQGVVKFDAIGKSKKFALRNNNDVSYNHNLIFNSNFNSVLNLIDEKIIVRDLNHNITFANFDFDSKAKCHKLLAGSDIPCPNCPVDSVANSDVKGQSVKVNENCISVFPLNSLVGDKIGTVEVVKRLK